MASSNSFLETLGVGGTGKQSPAFIARNFFWKSSVVASLAMIPKALQKAKLSARSLSGRLKQRWTTSRKDPPHSTGQARFWSSGRQWRMECKSLIQSRSATRTGDTSVMVVGAMTTSLLFEVMRLRLATMTGTNESKSHGKGLLRCEAKGCKTAKQTKSGKDTEWNPSGLPSNLLTQVFWDHFANTRLFSFFPVQRVAIQNPGHRLLLAQAGNAKSN